MLLGVGGDVDLVFSLVAALNIGFGVLGQEVVNEVRKRLQDRTFRRDVARLASAEGADGSVVNSDLINQILDSEYFVALITSRGGSTSVSADESLERALEAAADPIDDELSRTSLARAISRGVVGAALQDGSPLGRVLHAQLLDIDQTLLAGTNYLTDIYDLAAEIRANQEPAVPCTQIVADLESQSDVAVADASFVCQIGTFGASEDLRLDSGLYVRRLAEDAVFANSGKSEGELVAIVGEAGCGKTSTLWSVYQRLRGEGTRAWLLRTNSFGGAGSHRFQDLSRQLVAASRCVRQSGGEIAVLLDTVDVLLHNEHDRDGLLFLLERLKLAEVPVVVTCRNIESSLLPAYSRRVHLGDYSDSELRGALHSHERLFGNVESPSAGVGYEDLLAAVHWGSPILPILQRPLTLRMLFQVYAPESLPDDLNTFELFRNFWKQRVTQDRRPGSAFPVDSTNLGGTAKALAVAMLGSGSTVYDSSALDDGFEDRAIVTAEVDSLERRDILRRSGRSGSMIGFFHQAFFEHVAARALVEGGPPCFQALVARSRERPYDSFLMPIVEQALLLSQLRQDLSAEREAVLVEWLSSGNEVQFRAAVKVFSQQLKENPASCRVVVDLLRAPETPETWCRVVLTASRNILPNRGSELVMVVSAALRSPNRRTQLEAIHVLPRVASIDPKSLIQMVDEGDVLRFMDGSSETHTSLNSFLQAVVVAGRDAPDWAVGQIHRLAVNGGNSYKDLILSRTVAVVHEQRRSLDAASLKAVWLPLMGSLAEGREVQSTTVVLVSDLVEEAARSEGQTARDLLVPGISSGRLRDSATLKAGLRMLDRLSEDTAQSVGSLLTTWDTSFLWAAEVELSELLSQCPPAAALTVKRWVQLLNAGDATGLAQLLSRVLRRQSNEVWANAITQSGRAEDPEAWLDDDILGLFLVDAALLGRWHAPSVMASLLKGGGTAKRRGATAAQLEHRVGDSPVAASWLLTLSRGLREPQRVIRVLSRSQHVALRHDVSEELANELAVWLNELSRAPDPNARASGARNRLELAQHRPDLERRQVDTLELLDAEPRSDVQHHLLGITAVRVQVGLTDPTWALRTATRLADSQVEAVRDQARILGAWASRAEGAWSARWSSAMAFCSASPVRGACLSACFALVVDQADERPIDASDALIDLGAVAGDSLSKKRLRSWAHEFRRPLARVLESLATQEQVDLVSRAVGLEDPLARATLDTAVPIVGIDLLPLVDSIVESQTASAGLRQTAAKHRERLRRPLGSAEWPEVHGLLA